MFGIIIPFGVRGKFRSECAMGGENPVVPNTAIIDAALATVLETKNQLGIGFPTFGAEYESASQQLRAISQEMVRVFQLAPWSGPAGEMFAIESQALANFVAELATVERNVAMVIRRQAGGVIGARKSLDEIHADLHAAKTAALALADSGNEPESLTLQEGAAANATSRCSGTVQELEVVTTSQAAKMANLCSGLTIMQRQLSLGFVPLRPQLSSIMSVAPGKLTNMATAVSHCAIALQTQSIAGPRILEQVQLTHGSRLTEEFNSCLAEFEAIHIKTLATICGGIDARATSLANAASNYQQCDTLAAENLQPKKRQKIFCEITSFPQFH
ncbi:MAG: hypothetical protein K2Q25_04760 [Mycobacteriaceae bacterium]|nr:hypothetical protein [Mycobacteriaceae bacterium]